MTRRIRDADFDGTVLDCFLIESEPYRRECTMAELVHYAVTIVESVIDDHWVITARLVVGEILDKPRELTFVLRVCHG